MTGLPALTAVSEVLLSALKDDAGMAALASRYLSKAKEKRERTKKIKAMANALSVERGRISQKIIPNARSRLQKEKFKDEASLSPSTASSKYTASVTKGIKKSSTHRRKSKKSSRKVESE
jgi:hypothetical protein